MSRSRKSKPPGGKPPPKDGSLTDSVDDRITKELAASGLKKRQAGGTPTAREQAAIRKLEQKREEEQRWQYYRSIPKKHWNAMSGRANQVLKTQAQIHGIPLEGATIDLPKVVRWLHDFLAENRIKLMRDDDGDPLLAGEATPALERYRAAKADLAELELQDRRSQTIDRAELHEKLSRSAALLRRVGDGLERVFGPEALEMFNDGIEAAMRAIGDGADGDNPANASAAEPIA